MYDLIIIGGGPAALSAAFYANGKQLKIALIAEELGGKIGWLESLAGPHREQYLPGNELAHLLTIRSTRASYLIHDRVATVTKRDNIFYVNTNEHGTLESLAVLVATGAAPLPLDVPGARQLLDRGLGYSITTYAHLAAGQQVAVIGATARAMSGVAELARSAARVFVLVPGTLGQLSPLGQVLRQQPNVEIIEGVEIRAIVGGEQVTAVELCVDGVTRRIAVTRAFVAIGLMPNSALVRDLVQTDPDGFIMVNAYHETSLPGLYAAGDVSASFSEQVIIAMGDGARAAMSAYDYLLAQWLSAQP